jgi:hypothetical protein
MIYFIGNKQFDVVKIGVANHIKSRLKGIQTSCPFDLTLLFSTDGTTSLERRYHQLFKDQRIRGEWFKLSGPIQEFINNGKPITKYGRENDPHYIPPF